MRRSRKPVWAFPSIGGSNPPLSVFLLTPSPAPGPPGPTRVSEARAWSGHRRRRSATRSAYAHRPVRDAQLASSGANPGLNNQTLHPTYGNPIRLRSQIHRGEQLIERLTAGDPYLAKAAPFIDPPRTIIDVDLKPEPLRPAVPRIDLTRGEQSGADALPSKLPKSVNRDHFGLGISPAPDRITRLGSCRDRDMRSREVVNPELEIAIESGEPCLFALGFDFGDVAALTSIDEGEVPHGGGSQRK